MRKTVCLALRPLVVMWAILFKLGTRARAVALEWARTCRRHRKQNAPGAAHRSSTDRHLSRKPNWRLSWTSLKAARERKLRGREGREG